MNTKTKRQYDSESLVEMVTAKGSRYQVPESLKAFTVSAIIRSLTADGWSRWEIHKVTKIRYQHVRNVLEQPLAKK